jgi:hypothetical protein
MLFKSKYIDEIYHYKGEWDVPSFCGLKLVNSSGRTIIIASEMYETNPGSSVTSRVQFLAKELIEKFNIPHERLIFIEHNPDRKSSLEFYKETFDMVEFDWDGTKFTKPTWRRITIDEVKEITGIG